MKRSIKNNPEIHSAIFINELIRFRRELDALKSRMICYAVLPNQAAFQGMIDHLNETMENEVIRNSESVAEGQPYTFEVPDDHPALRVLS